MTTPSALDHNDNTVDDEDFEPLEGEAQDVTGISRASRQAFDGIEGALDRLNRLAVAIRRSSNSNLVSRAKKFTRQRDRDDDFERLVLTIVKWQFRDISEPLALQLAASVSYRRQRLMYQRNHQRKLQTRRQRHLTPELADTVSHEQPQLLPQLQTLAAQEPANRTHSETVPSTIDPVRVWQDYADHETVLSKGTTVSSRVDKEHPYPNPPKPSDESAPSIECNWCFRPLEPSKLEKPGWWRYVQL